MWQSEDGIFLGQGKYAVEILKRFRMKDCMTTPMASNMKLLSDASSNSVDAMMYHQMIGSLMYLIEYKTKNLLCYEHIETCSLDFCKAYSEVPERYS